MLAVGVDLLNGVLTVLNRISIVRHVRIDRQGDGKAATHAWLADHGDLPFVRLDNAAHNGETQTAALIIGMATSVKTFKDLGGFFWVNAAPIVFDPQRDLGFGGCYTDFHLTTPGCELEGIVQQVAEDSLNLATVNPGQRGLLW